MSRESDLLLKQLDRPIIEGLESDEGLEVSEDAYWQHYYDRDDFAYEWNNGVLEVKPMADYQSSETYKWFLILLEEYLKFNPVAESIYLDIGFRLELAGKKVTIRKPDLALILKSNPVEITKTDSTYKGIYDVCVEFLSDSKTSEIERDTVVKKAEYGQAGVKEYYIIDRQGKETAFYYLSKQGYYLPMRLKAGIFQSEVLPGWQFRVDDLYKQPVLKTLINDPVYQSYVLLDYQKSLTETKQAKQETEQAKQETEQAKQETEQAKQETKQAKQETELAKHEAVLQVEQAKQEAVQQVELAKQETELAKQEAEQANLRAKKIAEKLLELGIDTDSL